MNAKHWLIPSLMVAVIFWVITAFFMMNEINAQNAGVPWYYMINVDNGVMFFLLCSIGLTALAAWNIIDYRRDRHG